MKLDTRFQIKVTRGFFVNNNDLIIIGPLTRTGAENIKTVRADGNDFTRQGWSSRFSPLIARIFEGDRGVRDRVRGCRRIFNAFNRYRRSSVGRQAGDGKHRTLIIHHPARRRGVLSDANSVSGRQTGHHAGPRDRDAAGKGVIAWCRPTDRVNRIGENDCDLCVRAMPHGPHRFYTYSVGWNDESAQARGQRNTNQDF